MKFSYNWLKELVNLRESPEDLAELLMLHAFEVETVERVGQDWALEVKIPANRISDAGNHTGLAREIGAILNLKCKIQNSKLQVKIQNDRKAPVQIKIAKPELCPRYTAQALEIKTLGKSPKWMQDRLITCGFRPINAVVDVTNYVMLELGQPLHAFDLEKIFGAEMTVREAQEGEELVTLDGSKHILPSGTIIIEDARRIIDLAGIMGGENSAVSCTTKKIFLQAAVFNPLRIYKTARTLNFSSAASKIYAAGIDPNGTLRALERAIYLLKEIAGAEVINGLVDFYYQKVAPIRIFFRPSYANNLIGQEFKPIFYKTLLERQGFRVEKRGENFIVTVPTFRRDLQLEEDLIEEIARLYGYEKIPARIPEISLLPSRRNDELFWQERIRDYLAAAGFSESELYEFIGARELELFYLNQEMAVELKNPTSQETQYLVPRPLVKYISSAAENLRNFDLVKIFGIAKSFRNKSGLVGSNKGMGMTIDEHKDLVIVFARKGASGEKEFYELKGTLDRLLESMGISEYWYDDQIDNRLLVTDYKLFHPYRVAEIKIGDKKIGDLGEIHPEVLKNIKAPARMVAAEIDFGKLWPLASTESEYRPVGKYPAVIRDVAVIVPLDIRTEAVTNIIENLGGKYLVDTDLFDYFQDETLREANKKSLAFHLVFQSPERTLKDEEVNKLVKKIIKALEEKGWEVRK